jgi:hypothetical protein
VIDLRNLGSALLMLAAAGCARSGPAAGPAPLRWIVVEKRAGDVLAEGRVGDGRVDPEAVLLTMQPLYREDVAWEVAVDPGDFFVEILELTPKAQAAPGETVSARVRVARARPEELYRLTARSSQAGVTILGPSQRIVKGNSPAAFQFTSLEPGRAGIALSVEMLDGSR